MNVVAGNCFHLQSISTLSFHLWVLLNDPVGASRAIALVNFTEDTGIDPTVVIQPQENLHPFIVKPTMVEYARPLIIKEAVLINALNGGHASKHSVDCPAELLTRIRAGVFTSDFASPKLKNFCTGLF